jgi:hypothetical protein
MLTSVGRKSGTEQPRPRKRKPVVADDEDSGASEPVVRKRLARKAKEEATPTTKPKASISPVVFTPLTLMDDTTDEEPDIWGSDTVTACIATIDKMKADLLAVWEALPPMEGSKKKDPAIKALLSSASGHAVRIADLAQGLVRLVSGEVSERPTLE